MYDYIVKNGIIVDGSAKKPYAGTVCIKDGKIDKIIPETEGRQGECVADAAKVIDAGGHIVAPGFINLHCHSDRTYLRSPSYESMLTSGVTLEICGQCGLSSIPLGNHSGEHSSAGGGLLKIDEQTSLAHNPKNMEEYVKDVEGVGVSINVGMMIGHGALRAAVMGWDQRPLTKSELDEMCELLDRELKAGALGVTFGLIYPPGSCCDTGEIKALARVCAANNKVLSVHMRNENRKVFQALDEMLDVARETGVRLEISHLKLMGKTMWGKSGELLAKIDMARAEGIAIHADQYPYDASHSGLQSSLPREAVDGGYPKFFEKLHDDEWWDKISDHGTLPEMEFRGGAENIVINELRADATHPEFVGMSITEIAKMLDTDISDAVRQILLSSGARVQCVYHNMSMDDVLNIMSRRDISVISDGTAYDFNYYGGCPHPRNAGTFARFFRLVRENNLMPIEDAVYKVTGLPASVLGMGKRFGFIKEGLDATLTIFDKDEITDHATYEEPAQASTGIDYVIVNGEVVLDHGKITDARPGKVILG
ncbi:MAG: D-aminoacylase [Lachnospiraceae bacterium]|nr:D-aminoacylase [Lachnospiraceae bacterium]